MDKQGVWILYLCRRDGSDDPSLLALNKAGGCLPQAHVRACRLFRHSGFVPRVAFVQLEARRVSLMLEGSPVPQPGSFGQGWDLVMAILIGGFLYASLGTAYNVKVKQMPLVSRTMIAGLWAAVSKQTSSCWTGRGGVSAG